jgi:hypothetical protein
MANCVRHETIGQELVAKWPRRGSRFCTEPCAALYALEMVTETEANAVVEKTVGGSQPHARGHSTSQAPGNPRQAVGTPRATGTPRHAPAGAPAATATAEPEGDGDDGIVQGDGLDDMTKDALKSECESLGLAVGGTKDDLIARIRDHHDAD